MVNEVTITPNFWVHSSPGERLAPELEMDMEWTRSGEMEEIRRLLGM